LTAPDSTNLAELLERILDKGIVIAGDIAISLVDIELLTIKLRLLIASVDKAREIGVTWWESDPWLKGNGSSGSDQQTLESRLDRIEAALERLGLPDGEPDDASGAQTPRRGRARRTDSPGQAARRGTRRRAPEDGEA
jgi:hypothetical protein